MSARVILIAAAVVAVGAASPAFAAIGQCVQFETVGKGATTDYQPFDPAPTVDSFELRARSVNDSVASVRFLLVDTAPHNSGPGIGTAGPDNYDVIWLTDSSKRVLVQGQEQPVAMAGAVIALGNRSGQGTTQFQLSIPAGQEAIARRHQENLTVRYQCLDENGLPLGPVQEQYTGVDLAVTVPAYAAAFVGSIGQTTGMIDFGELGTSDSDVTKSIGIVALSTTPYEITVVSESNSRLISPGNGSAAIPYKMAYAGQEVASGGRVICPMTRAPMGTTEQFSVTLDGKAVATQPAGTYHGAVILTVTPRDLIVQNSCGASRGANGPATK